MQATERAREERKTAGCDAASRKGEQMFLGIRGRCLPVCVCALVAFVAFASRVGDRGAWCWPFVPFVGLFLGPVVLGLCLLGGRVWLLGVWLWP